MKRYWNFRVLEWADPSGAVWSAIHEVYYDKGAPISYGAQPAPVLLLREDGDMPELGRLLDRMSEALDQPILTVADFPAGKRNGPPFDSRRDPYRASSRTPETGRAQTMHRRVFSHTRPIAWEATLLDAGDGSGDVVIELPAELLERAGWRIGTVLNLKVEDGKCMLRAL